MKRYRLRRAGYFTRERATTLILVPTMMLVLIALAGIAIDLSALHMAKRRTQAVVALAASDAAGMIDERVLYRDGGMRIDGERAHQVALAHISSANLPGSIISTPTTTVSADGTHLTVSIQIRIKHLFIGSISGSNADELTVSASARLIAD